MQMKEETKMRTIALAAFAVSLIGSSAAYADALVTGTAKIPPVFAVPSGNTSYVVDAGSASRAPVYAYPSGTSGDVIEIGNAHSAPVFAQVHRAGAEAQVASGQPGGTAAGNN
jgi:hypothetical protein